MMETASQVGTGVVINMFYVVMSGFMSIGAEFHTRIIFISIQEVKEI